MFTTTEVDSSIILETLRSSTLVDESEAVEDETCCTLALEVVSECFGEVVEHVFSTSTIDDNNGVLPDFSPQRSVFIVSDT